MAEQDALQMLVAARASLAKPLGFADVLAKLSGKDRANAERRVVALDALQLPELTRVWQRLTCSLMTLAPIARFAGRQAVEFFVPDGPYRTQVFALEDLQDGNLTVYCPDVLAEAAAAGLITPTGAPEPDGYAVSATAERLRIDVLDAAAMSPAAHYKNLTNWKRRAFRITLLPSASPGQIETAELLCAIAARHFAPAPEPVDPKSPGAR